MSKKYINYENALWVIVIIVAYLDLHSTYIGLSMGLVEENPVGDYLIDTVGFVGLSTFKLFIIVFCYKLSEKLMYGNWVYLTPILLSAIWTLATVINTYYIFKVM